MIRFFVKRPVTTVMFVLLWVVLGIVAFPRMNVERIPAIDLPMVTATFIYPGATPGEMESLVLEKAEDAMTEVSGLKHLTTQAFDSSGFVMAEFNLGVNVNDKANEVKSKLDAIASQFPDGMKQPIIAKLNPLAQPVMDIAISGADPRELQYYVDNILANRVTAIPGVANVDTFGGRARAIRVKMYPEQMAARGVSVTDITNAIGAQNVNIPGGKIDAGSDSNPVRFIGEFQSVDDIRNLRIVTVEGLNFTLKQVANITDSSRDIETGARVNGDPVVIVSVVKASDGNAVKIAAAVRKQIPIWKSDLQKYFADKNPGGTKPEMRIVSDSSTAVSNETNNTLRDIFIGLALTIATLLIFTRNWRTTVIAGVMIPASLISGLFFMDISGFTINAMTLLAIATALGTLITDAIILIESALRLIEEGMDPEEAAVIGTKKVAVRIFATIGTHVVVFLPLAFMGGIAGQFMAQFGLSVVYLVLLSSAFSFTLTPMMIAKILKKSSVASRQSPVKNTFVKKKFQLKENNTDSSRLATGDLPAAKPLAWFRPFFDWQINHPWRAVGIAVLAFVLSVIPMRWVGNEFSPSTDANEITINIRAPVGSTFEKSESIAKQTEATVKQFPQVQLITTKIGDRGLQNITFKVELINHSKRHISDKMLAQKMLPLLSQIPDAEVQIRAGVSGMGGGGAVQSDMVLNINGSDNATREAYADQVLKILNRIPEIQSAVRVQQAPGTELRFVPDVQKMNLWGIKNAAAGSVLRTALFGNDTFKFKDGGKEYPIILEFDGAFKNREMFGITYANSPKGLVALSQIGQIIAARATPEIYRLDKSRITTININLGKSTMGPVQKKIQAEMDKMDWKPGYYAKFGGMSEMQSDTQGEIGIAFLLATILTYMVLAAILNSYAQPLTIASGILTSFTGVFIMLFLTGASMNIAGMMAIVMLVGLAVSTNILILEPTLEDMERGKSGAAAMWDQFVDKRRMLVMTTVAVVAGLVPQLFSIDGMKTSMGAVIIGGILASLFWTFFLTPALFTLFERMRKHK